MISLPTMHIGPLQLRDLTADDKPQVLRIYATSRGDDPLLALWPQDQLAAFLQSQCQAQHQHYLQHYAGAEFKLLELDGQLVGRLYWHCLPSELRLVEITVLPEFRSRGYGTVLVQHLQAVAREQQLPMALQVACTNHRAQALYQRLGFVVQDGNGVHTQMLCAQPSRPISAPDHAMHQEAVAHTAFTALAALTT